MGLVNLCGVRGGVAHTLDGEIPFHALLYIYLKCYHDDFQKSLFCFDHLSENIMTYHRIVTTLCSALFSSFASDDAGLCYSATSHFALVHTSNVTLMNLFDSNILCLDVSFSA